MHDHYKNGAIQALVVAIYEIGAFLGSAFIIIYGDKLGRRKAILPGGVILIIGMSKFTFKI